MKKNKKEAGVIVTPHPGWKWYTTGEEQKGDVWRKVAIYTPFALSAGFLIRGLIHATLTGAIIGGGEVDVNILFGIGFLLLGLAIHHFTSSR